MSREMMSQLLALGYSAEGSAGLLCNRVSIRRNIGEDTDVAWVWVIWVIEESKRMNA
jgi:hypothetical protein